MCRKPHRSCGRPGFRKEEAIKKPKGAPHYPPYVRDRLRRQRLQNKLTQKEVAEILGISQQSYSAYEKGLSYMHIDQFMVLARLYDVSVDYITGASSLIRPFPKN